MPRSSSSSIATSSAANETNRLQSAASAQRDAGVVDVLAEAQRCFDAEQYAESAPLFQQLLRINPNHPVALHRLGAIASRIGMPDRAIRLLRQTLRAGADSAELLNDLGAAFVDIGDWENARRCFSRCVDRFPTSPLGYVSSAYLENAKGDFEAAESLYLQAINRASDSFEAKFNLATLYREWGRLDQAIELYDRLIGEQPHIGLLRDGRARARLQNRDWQYGWQDYEARLTLENEPAKINLKHSIPRWDGQSNKRLLILHEQGVGDEVQFASCYADVLACSDQCTITCSPRLLPIFQRSFPEATLIAVDPAERAEWTPDQPQDFDYVVPAGSLPGFFRHKDGDFSGRPYLNVGRRQNESHHRVTDKLRVGISWWGGAIADQIQKRSVPLGDFKRLLDVPNVQFVNLQHGRNNEAAVSELATVCNLETHPSIDPYQELDAWFDLIASLDLLISVDNSNVHFAGAIGTPTWLLLPNHPNWRWPDAQEHSHWYSSVRFIRKRCHGDWTSTIDTVAEQLVRYVDQIGNATA